MCVYSIECPSDLFIRETPFWTTVIDISFSFVALILQATWVINKLKMISISMWNK